MQSECKKRKKRSMRINDMVKEIHEMLKKTLSPEDYIKLLELMMKDVEKMIEWGEKN